MNKKITKKRYFRLYGITAGVMAVVMLLGIDNRLKTVEYQINTSKIQGEIRLAVIADLHSCDYGRKQQELIGAVDASSPDAIVMVGDIVDDRLSMSKAIEFFEGIAGRYPCYYVSGNHEYWSGNIEGIKSLINTYGIEVLEGESRSLTVGDSVIQISGIDDPDGGEKRWTRQWESVLEAEDEALFSILLSHRPEYAALYGEAGFDLILAGHAHGGQWRIPGILNGLLAPNQGLFPKYAGGFYDLGNNQLIVSRGLARESTKVPRIYNRPELVIVDIMGSDRD